MGLFSKEDLKKFRPFFQNLNDCIGVIIFLYDDYTLIYHHHIATSMQSFKREIKAKFSKNDIKKIQFFGGNIGNFFIKGRTGQFITKKDKQEEICSKNDNYDYYFQINNLLN